MIRSLNSGVTGIQQFQERLDVIANNIANNSSGVSLPAWAESNWDNKIGARTFMYDSQAHEGSVFASGFLSMIVGVVYFLFIHDRFVLPWLTQSA